MRLEKLKRTRLYVLSVFPLISQRVQIYGLGLTNVVVRLGNGVMNSLFWTFFLTGSVSMAVSILVLGYAANHLGLPVKEAVHRALVS
jgi:hypothetical protein